MRTMLTVGFLLLAAVGCDEALCVPGESQACVGAAGCSGGQRCNDDGTAFEACLCAGDETCGADVCQGSEACCDDSCVDTDTDAMNCGACGNVCGGPCSGGSCGIVLMDSGM
ncbi:MAG: hypothetical protein RLP09_04175 [Sandaracinaceae bacterium]